MTSGGAIESSRPSSTARIVVVSVLFVLLIVITIFLVLVGLLSGLGVDGCRDYIRNGCTVFEGGFDVVLVGPAAVAIATLVTAVVFIVRAKRRAWLVLIVGIAVEIVVFLVGVGVENTALGQPFSADRYAEANTSASASKNVPQPSATRPYSSAER